MMTFSMLASILPAVPATSTRRASRTAGSATGSDLDMVREYSGGEGQRREKGDAAREPQSQYRVLSTVYSVLGTHHSVLAAATPSTSRKQEPADVDLCLSCSFC